MKLSAKEYAEILYEILEKKKESELPAEIKKFITILARHKKLNLWKKIIYFFSKIYNEKNGIMKIKVIAPLKLDENLITKKFANKKVEIEEVEDRALIGGVILQIDDLLVDGSIKNKLNNLYRQLCQ